MVTLRAHRHFTMQARALRVPELCDDHTPPSCLVTNSLAEPRCRSVNTLVLPDPLLTQGGPVTFQACALHQLFVRSCDLAHRGLYCSHVCVCTHHSSLQQHLSVFVSPCSIWTNLSTCGCLLAPLSGITLTTRVFRSQHHTLSNSYKLARAPRPLCRCRPPHGCHMVQRLQALCPAHRSHTVPSVHRFRRAPPALSQVTFCQLRWLRLPRSSPLLLFWSVASLFTLLRRPSCQSPPHLWMLLRRLFHTSLSLRTFLRNSRSRSSLSDVSTRIIPRGPWLHLLRTMFSAPFPTRPLRYFLTRLCRRLCTAWHLAMPPHNYLSRSFSSVASSPMNLQTAKARHRHIVMLAAPHRLNLRTLLRFVAPAAPATPATVTRTLRPHARYHSLHRVSRRMPVSAPHMVYLLKRLRCDLVCVHPSQSRPHSHMSVPPKWEHILCAQLLPNKRSASTALAGTHNPVGADPRAGTGPFPKPRALVLPMVKFGQAKPDGLGHIGTADCDLMHHQYRLSVLQWNPGTARRNPTNIIAAACGKFHAVILQEASDHVPHISNQFIAHTGNTDVAILLNKDTFEPNPMVFALQ